MTEFQPRKITIVFNGRFSDTKERFTETAIGYLIAPTIVYEINDDEIVFREVDAVSNEDYVVFIDVDSDGNRFDLNLAGKTKKLEDPLALASLTVPELLKLLFKS
ncbi:hypothetical protein LIT25_21365 [Bacillus sp. F19]|nr:hypothetical protein LIT25_21365 [Bacillus sp. F19]